VKSLKFEKNKPVLQTNDELRNMSAIKVPAAKLCSDDKSEKLTLETHSDEIGSFKLDTAKVRASNQRL